MKHTSRNAQATLLPPGRKRKRHGAPKDRHEMNRFLRRFLILILILMIAAVLLSGYASLFPVHFTAPVPVFTSSDSRIDYEVLLKSNSFTDQLTMGMDQTYLLDFTQGVNAIFAHQRKVSRALNLRWLYRVDAVLEARAAGADGQLLLSRIIDLVPETAGAAEGSLLSVESTVDILFSDFDLFIREFNAQTSQPAVFELTVKMPVDVIADLPDGPFAIRDELILKIPLSLESFTITATKPANTPWPIWHTTGYRLVLAEIPFPVFPAMAAAAFLLLILLLTTTRSRPKSRLKRQLSRMLRLAKGQLMMIADKAWEPEWCIASADFRSMVNTAKKLKHPIFCYIDRQSQSLAAYFYVYYGENNYCYSFNSTPTEAAGEIGSDDTLPDLSDMSGSTGSLGPTEPVELDDRIPLLPEIDDSPEIFLANLKMSASFGHPAS